MRRLILATAAAAPLLLGAGPAKPPPLTPDGWGAARIGMTEAELTRRFHFKIPADDGENSDDCREFELPAGAPNMIIMTEKGRVTRITIWDKSRIVTDRGLGIGSRAAAVRKAYAAALKVEPNAYDDAEQYLTVWSERRGRGIRYETDEKGRVVSIHAGGASIHYIEDCL